MAAFAVSDKARTMTGTALNITGGTNAGRHDLFRQQEALQGEATEVEIDLGLMFS